MGDDLDVDALLDDALDKEVSDKQYRYLMLKSIEELDETNTEQTEKMV